MLEHGRIINLMVKERDIRNPDDHTKSVHVEMSVI